MYDMLVYCRRFPRGRCGMLIGTGGAGIREVQDASGATVAIVKKERQKGKKNLVKSAQNFRQSSHTAHIICTYDSHMIFSYGFTIGLGPIQGYHRPMHHGERAGRSEVEESI